MFTSFNASEVHVVVNIYDVGLTCIAWWIELLAGALGMALYLGVSTFSFFIINTNKKTT